MLTDYSGATLWEADIASRIGRMPKHQCVVFGFEVDTSEPDKVRLTRRHYCIQDVQGDITFLCPSVDAASRACQAWAALAKEGVLPDRGLIISAPGAVWLRMTAEDLRDRGNSSVTPRRVGFGKAVLREQDWRAAGCRRILADWAEVLRAPSRPGPAEFVSAAA